MQQPDQPVLRDIVLVGGGHSHVGDLVAGRLARRISARNPDVTGRLIEPGTQIPGHFLCTLLLGRGGESTIRPCDECGILLNAIGISECQIDDGEYALPPGN